MSHGNFVLFTGKLVASADSASPLFHTPGLVFMGLHMNDLEPPKTPSDRLRLDCIKILARLRLIIEFRPWLDHAERIGFPGTPFAVVWNCFAFGASLCTLLDLLGSPSLVNSYIDVYKFDLGAAVVDRERALSQFIQRIQFLEFQGKLPYGEVLRIDDLFGGTTSGFAKALRTVERVLTALQESYPGLFVLPKGSQIGRQQLIQELLENERAHVADLRKMAESAIPLLDALEIISTETHLEPLVVNRMCLLQYHEHVLQGLENLISCPLNEKWDKVFAFGDNALDNILFTEAMSAYRSICTNYLNLTNFLERRLSVLESTLSVHALSLLDIHYKLLCHISEYHDLLQAILDVTMPTDCHSYNSLCESVFRMQNISEDIDEIGHRERTSRSNQILKGRAYIWNGIDPGELGTLLLDDCLAINASGSQFSVFLFSTMLLCCMEGVDKEQVEGYVPRYPIAPWELGPALRRTTPLNIIIHAIPTSHLRKLRRADSDSFEIDWIEENDNLHTILFFPTTPAQCNQWCSILQIFIPLIHDLSIITHPIGEDDPLLSDDEDAGGRRRSHPRPWSVIARKGRHSESSSMIRQNINDHESLLSPNLLPSLFNRPPDVPWSPLLIDTTPLHTPTKDAVFAGNMPPTPPSDSNDTDTDGSILLDLTGQITRDSRYPSAHGGFADVWEGIWHKEPDKRKVAVKVLRSHIDDPVVENKMLKRLRRELRVWGKLDHPNILPLYGIISDFGHYNSMVCPWLENGSVSKHMERCGDILSMSDRLQLLCEVAAGLAYLHAFSVIHGDLTGSNILIDDGGKACLCDFGLSSIVAEFHGTEYFNSTIGGAVRWADAQLFRIHDDQDKDHVPTVVSTCSDIYSFGSVTLEILSGRIPYHYIRTDAHVVIELHKGNKPRRPAQSFVTDAQWAFIERCWMDDPKERPDIEEVSTSIQAMYRASLEFRRHSA